MNELIFAGVLCILIAVGLLGYAFYLYKKKEIKFRIQMRSVPVSDYKTIKLSEKPKTFFLIIFAWVILAIIVGAFGIYILLI